MSLQGEWQRRPVNGEEEADAMDFEVELGAENDILQENDNEADEEGDLLPDISASVLSSLFDRVNVRMLISNEERRRALAIKAAILACEDLEPLSDMMYAQLALADRDNLEGAVNRARHLQIFRREYKLADTYEEGCEMSRKFLKQHPGHMLSVAYNAMEGNYVVIYDQANFDQSVLQHPRHWRVFLGYGWYLYHALSPDLHAMRQGVILIAECEGLNWKMLDMNTMQRVWQELLVAYPVTFRELKFFHTGVTANLTAALMKSFLPTRIHSKFNLGCQFEGRLDGYYRIPTQEIADKRIQAELECFLRMRYDNENAFTLE